MVFQHLYFEGHVPSRIRRRVPVVALPVRQKPVIPPGSDRFFSSLFGYVGLSTWAYRKSALQRRLPACLRFLGAKDVPTALQKLEDCPDLATPALSVVLLGVTAFFRDAAVFERLREELSTAWIRRETPHRVWSAASSDGQELYSVAMMLDDLGQLDSWELLGSDCRDEAIDAARRGVFAPSVAHKILSPWREKYFLESGGGLQVNAPLRNRICWKRADLVSEPEPGPWDLILWRNMAIYLEGAAADRIWSSLVRELAPGGLLMTGKAECPPPGLGLEKIAPCLFRKRLSP